MFPFLFYQVSCESDEEAKCSPEKVTNKPLEVDDDGDDDGGGNGTGTGIDNEVTYANSCPIDISLRDCADREINGFADFVESDFDLKVITYVHLDFIICHACFPLLIFCDR